jgi:hypothetical protein
MTRRSCLWSVFVSSSAALLAACGGGGSSTPGAPNNPAAPPGAASPSPRPNPTPTPDPRLGLPAGPVARFTIKVRTVDNGTRDAEPDAQGRFVVFVGERVDFDSTQKNVAGDICAWTNNPTWLINDRDVPEDTSAGIVLRRGSSQPFLLKLTMEGTGSFAVRARIDGVDSNVLEMRVRSR